MTTIKAVKKQRVSILLKHVTKRNTSDYEVRLMKMTPLGSLLIPCQCKRPYLVQIKEETIWTSEEDEGKRHPDPRDLKY